MFRQRKIMLIFVMIAAVLTFGVLFFIIGYILVKGLPYINLDMFSMEYNSENSSIMPAMINTVVITLISLVIAAPIGILSAIYLNEYAKKGNKLVKIIDITTQTLSGIPSIVYGLFGSLFFVTALNMGLSIISGACTLAIMILPLIMKTTLEAIKAVPENFKEGSFGLGAGRLRTIFKIILPYAIPGILSGIILATGRIVGETAALIYTSGTVTAIASTPADSGITLSTQMWKLSTEGLYVNQAYATAVILIVVVVLINLASTKIAKRLTTKQ